MADFFRFQICPIWKLFHKPESSSTLRGWARITMKAKIVRQPHSCTSLNFDQHWKSDECMKLAHEIPSVKPSWYSHIAERHFSWNCPTFLFSRELKPWPWMVLTCRLDVPELISRFHLQHNVNNRSIIGVRADHQTLVDHQEAQGKWEMIFSP